MQERKTREQALGMFPDSFGMWLPGATDDELKWLSRQVINDVKREQLARELEIRRVQKTHWTVTPGFVVLVITMAFAGIAAWPVIHDWISTVVKKGSVSESEPVLRKATTPAPIRVPSIAVSPLPTQATSSSVSIPTPTSPP